ncbi:MAG: hypothetical protein LBK60_02425 [Verrucomicrobiales bacterium]|nr:hypothetical protein [Verrucomicrobiales bacterium]
MAKRKSAGVSMTPEFEGMAKRRATDLGFSTFSAYVNQLIRSDLMSGGPLTITAIGSRAIAANGSVRIASCERKRKKN